MVVSTNEGLRARALRAQLDELFNQKRWNEITSILEEESRRSKLELWQLVIKSRAILLGDENSLPLETAGEALEETLEREPDYVPAMIDMAHYLDTHEDKADSAVELFHQATDVILGQLLNAVKGWAEAKLLDDEVRKEMLRSYNQFLEVLHTHGLEAGSAARRVDWFDPEQFGDDL